MLIFILRVHFILKLSLTVSVFHYNLHDAYNQWIEENTTESYNNIIHHFKFKIIEKDVMLPYPSLLSAVLDACYALDTIELDLFAHTAWKFITKHCRLQPYAIQFSKMFKIYRQAVVRSPNCYALHIMMQSIQLMDEFLESFEKDPIRLNANMKHLCKFCTIVVDFKQWNVTQKRKMIEFYYNAAIQLRIPLFCPIQRFLSKIDRTHDQQNTSSTEFADGSPPKMIVDKDVRDIYLAQYKEWKTLNHSAELIINHFNTNIINDNAYVMSHQLVTMVLDACFEIKNFIFAETVWIYLTKECGFRPNQWMFEHMMTLYAKEDPVNIERCWKIYAEWLHALKHNRESLTNVSHTKQYSKKMIRQMMLILDAASNHYYRVNNVTKLEMIRRCYNAFISCDVRVCRETVQLYVAVLKKANIT